LLAVTTQLVDMLDPSGDSNLRLYAEPSTAKRSEAA
jgi:hypothetical protein